MYLFIKQSHYNFLQNYDVGTHDVGTHDVGTQSPEVCTEVHKLEYVRPGNIGWFRKYTAQV